MYKLIAFDVDGTLYNSNKQISKDTKMAILDAIDKGKEVVISSGRCLKELEPILNEMSQIRYCIMTSGAIVYDCKEKKEIYSCKLDIKYVQKVLEVSQDLDTMVQIMMETSIFEKEKGKRMVDYGMAVYQSMFDEIAIFVEDIYEYYNQNPFCVDKINIYHRNEKDREISYSKLKDLPMSLKYSEQTSIECSNISVNKGIGLKKLCDYLDIDIKDTIAVGDGDNDMDMLKIAGLSIAMGNANENIKSICDVIVSDNDHDGCEEAIYDYLLL